MGISVIKPGLLSTIQDFGRQGYRKEGVTVSGAMDKLALQIGNLLLGNEESLAGIECTLTGPELLFDSDQLIVITGADLSAEVDQLPVKMWRPLFIKKNSILRFGTAIEGCRAYIAVAGGFDLPLILNSSSTYLKAAFGGYKGRALKKGDYIPFALSYKGPQLKSSWSVDLSKLYTFDPDPIVHIIEGPEYNWFSDLAKAELVEQDFQISVASDRMGYRLIGPEMKPDITRELLSSAVAFGTLQVTGDGSAILLMADHQTTGGYPRIAQVISADHTILAQLQPGMRIRFRLISLTEAHELLRARARQLKQLKHTLMLKGISK